MKCFTYLGILFYKLLTVPENNRLCCHYIVVTLKRNRKQNCYDKKLKKIFKYWTKAFLNLESPSYYFLCYNVSKFKFVYTHEPNWHVDIEDVREVRKPCFSMHKPDRTELYHGLKENRWKIAPALCFTECLRMPEVHSLTPLPLPFPSFNGRQRTCAASDVAGIHGR